MNARLQHHDAVPGSKALKNPRHEKLAREVAAGNSMATAWREAGLDPKASNASRTFRRPEIQERVEFLRQEFNRHAGISLAALQSRLLRIADANLIDLFEADERAGKLRLKNLTALPRSVTAPIRELQIDEDGAVKLKTADPLHAIDSLLRTIGGFAPERADGGKGVSLEDIVLASMKDGRSAAVAVNVITGVPQPHHDSENDADTVGGTARGPGWV
jgi:Terminase small subunit